jgi:hypothetical protein
VDEITELYVGGRGDLRGGPIEHAVSVVYDLNTLAAITDIALRPALGYPFADLSPVCIGIKGALATAQLYQNAKCGSIEFNFGLNQRVQVTQNFLALNYNGEGVAQTITQLTEAPFEYHQLAISVATGSYLLQNARVVVNNNCAYRNSLDGKLVGSRRTQDAIETGNELVTLEFGLLTPLPRLTQGHLADEIVKSLAFGVVAANADGDALELDVTGFASGRVVRTITDSENRPVYQYRASCKPNGGGTTSPISISIT